MKISNAQSKIFGSSSRARIDLDLVCYKETTWIDTLYVETIEDRKVMLPLGRKVAIKMAKYILRKYGVSERKKK